MPSVTVRFHVARPREEVFDYVADTRHDVKWAPLVHGVKQVEGDGPGLGAEYDIEQEGRGRVTTLRMRVVEFEAGRRIAWEMSSRSLDYRSTMTFKDDGDGTRVVQTNRVRLGRLLDNIGWRLIAKGVLKRQVSGLQDQLERGHAARAAREG